MPVPVIKAIRISDAASIAQADAYPGVDLLADAADPVLPGGTGRRYDENLVAGLARRRRVIVAGGLNPDNVAEVVRRVRPWGVDVAGGVESSPGLKDHARVARFVAAARDVLS
jgi:phosphoribosylanthranilate isomerase